GAQVVEGGLQYRLGCGDAPGTGDPPARPKGGAASDARRRDVAVHATLVAEAVVVAGLAEQFVELRLVRRRDLGADFSYASVVRGGLGFAGNSNVESPQKRVWQFECRG